MTNGGRLGPIVIAAGEAGVDLQAVFMGIEITVVPYAVPTWSPSVAHGYSSPAP